MRAWRVAANGDPAVALEQVTVPDPRPSRGEVLIQVAAAGLNFADILACQGRYQVHPQPPFIPGLELAGTIVAVGEGVDHLAAGDRVAAQTTTTLGALAEKVAVAHRWVSRIPSSLSFSRAAALPITYGTGWYALHARAGIRAGEWLLVHAGAGGVGSAAIQLGRATGARVLATAGGEEKVRLCRQLGAEVALDYRTEDFVEVVERHTAGHGADVVYDPVGGDVFDSSRRCVAWGGRILVIGFASGHIADIPANHVLVKNYSVVGVHWGGAVERDLELLPRAHFEIMRLHAAGAIDPLLFSEVPFDEVPAALGLLASGGTWGKVVVSVG
jgi:NADPH2:quinone reductase